MEDFNKYLLVERKSQQIGMSEAGAIIHIDEFIQASPGKQRHALFIKNTSNETDVKLALLSKLDADIYSIVDGTGNPIIITIPAGQKYMIQVEGLYNGDGLSMDITVISEVTIGFDVGIAIFEA